MTLERVDSPLAGRRPGPLGPVGGVSTLGGQAPSGPSMVPPLAERSAAPFWLELKGVERWFDTLDPGERLTLMASLFGRSSEAQLRQFSAAVDKSLQTAQYATAAPASSGQPSFASNLNRFGVGQPATTQSPDYAALRYRTPLQKQPSGSGNPTGGVAGAPGSVPGTSAGSGAAAAPGTATVATTTVSTGSGYMSPLSGPLSAPLGGSTSSQNPYTPSSDLYAQAFLPLPRSKSYTPWGPEIRPKSAASDAWHDLGSGRASPQPAQSSPNLAALSLEQTSASTSTSPIGHPIKPWRTFTPVGLGQAPEQFEPGRVSRPVPSSHTGPSSSGVLGNGSAGMPTTASSSKAPPPPVPPLTVELNSRTGQSPRSAVPGGPTGSPFATQLGAQSNQLNSPSPFQKQGASPVHELSPNPPSNTLGVGSSTNDSGSPTSSLYSLSGKQSPKRGVNVVDVALLSDIGAWLRSLRLHKYTGNLAGMRWQDVIQLDDADLEARGVNALGARRKLLKMFEEIRQAQEAGLLPDEDN